MCNNDMTTSEIIERVYDAWTLDDAIFWREQFVRRLSQMIANSSVLDPAQSDEVALYAAAKAQSEQAIARLQMALARGETFCWTPPTPAAPRQADS